MVPVRDNNSHVSVGTSNINFQMLETHAKLTYLYPYGPSPKKERPLYRKEEKEIRSTIPASSHEDSAAKKEKQ